MSGKAGFAVSISATDNGFGATLDSLSKRIQALNAPAERINKSMAKFGEVTGVTRVAEGVKGLGDRSLETARAMERMVSPMSLLTSGASIAGIAEMTRRWGEAANSIGKVGYMLDMPVEKLGDLRIAMKMTGGSAETLQSGLSSLRQHLRAVAFNRESAQPLIAMGIDAVPGRVTKVTEALAQLSRFVKANQGNPGKVAAGLEALGIPADFVPLLKNLDGLLADAEKTHGAMTDKMVKDANELTHSMGALEGAIGGVVNRFVDGLEPTAKRWIDGATKFIESDLARADSITKIGTAVMALGALKPAALALRLLGLTGTAAAAEVAIPVGAGILAGGIAGSMQVPMVDDSGRVVGNWGGRDESSNPGYGGLGNGPGRSEWWRRHAPEWLGGDPAPSGGSRLAGPRAGSSGGNALDVETISRATAFHDRLMKAGIPGMTDARAWGFAGNAVQESRANPNSNPGDMGAAHGLMMWRDDRLSRYVDRYHHLPEQGNLDEATDYVKAELAGPEADAWHKIQMAPDTPGESGAAISRFYERPKDTEAEASRRWGLSQNLAGHVRVDIHHHNAPAGTTSTATGTGAVMVTAPRIETSVPGFLGW